MNNVVERSLNRHVEDDGGAKLEIEKGYKSTLYMMIKGNKRDSTSPRLGRNIHEVSKRHGVIF